MDQTLQDQTLQDQTLQDQTLQDHTLREQTTQDQTAQVAHALCRRVDRFFRQQEPRRQDITIRVQPVEQASLAEGRTQRCDLAFVLANGMRLRGALLTRFLGGNMYEIDASVGERTKRFTLCLPQPSVAADDGPGLKVCDYLFDEVKRAAGEVFLKEISARCRPGWELQ